MKRPNHGDYLSTGAAHTLEHLFATYARNSAYSSGVVYVGPMGCRTGFYLLTRGLTDAQVLELTVDSFALWLVLRARSPVPAKWSAATTWIWICLLPGQRPLQCCLYWKHCTPTNCIIEPLSPAARPVLAGRLFAP